MRRISSMLAFAVLVGASPLIAYADNAFTLRDVEVYTGPGSEYPPVATLPPNANVEVAGCLSDWSWCDVIFADSRGWVYAGDLGYPYENRRVAIIEIGPRINVFPVVAFSLPAYWDAHYRSRPWYRERDVWVGRVQARVEHGGRPPEGRAARAAPPSAGVTPPQGQAPQAQPPRGQATQAQPPQGQAPQAQPQGQAPQAGREPQSTQPRQPPETAQRPTQPQSSPQQTSPPQQGAPSMQSGRPPEGRPPEGRPPENRPPEARPPEGRPSAGGPPASRGPESQGPREAGPPSDRGQREGQGPQGQGPQGRGGDNGPDRDRQ